MNRAGILTNLGWGGGDGGRWSNPRTWRRSASSTPWRAASRLPRWRSPCHAGEPPAVRVPPAPPLGWNPSVSVASKSLRSEPAFRCSRLPGAPLPVFGDPPLPSGGWRWLSGQPGRGQVPRKFAFGAVASRTGGRHWKRGSQHQSGKGRSCSRVSTQALSLIFPSPKGEVRKAGTIPLRHRSSVPPVASLLPLPWPLPVPPPPPPLS